MIKVVEAISDSNIGGAGRLLLARLSTSDREAFETTVILPKQSKLRERFEKIGVATVAVGRGDASFSLFDVFEYYRTIKRLSPHIINSHAELSSRIAATLARVPVRIYTRHCAFGATKAYALAPVRMLSRAFFCISAHRAIAVAGAAREDLVSMGVPRGSISLIINGAMPVRKYGREQADALRRRLGLLSTATVVSIFARLEPCKDHETFLAAARIILSVDSSYRFLIVGDGSLREHLKKRAEALGIARFVRFTGFVEDVAPYMNITDVNVNCSVGTETSSLALSEGMSLGIPAVASDYGGNPYMVRDRVNGLIYPRRDPRELAKRILELSDPALYQRLSEAAYRRFCLELNAWRMTVRTEDLYRSLYRKRVRGRPR